MATNLWVISQDGGLFNITNIYHTNLAKEGNTPRIKTDIGNNTFILGNYLSTEDCVSVIGRISKLLMETESGKKIIYHLPDKYDEKIKNK